MIVKFYGIFDTAAGECVRQITSKNDETAKRAVSYIVREKGFDRIAGRDYVLEHLYDFDTETRLIVDNTIVVVGNFGQALAEVEAEEKLEQLQEALKPANEEKAEEPHFESEE